MGARPPAWDKYEAALLLEGVLDVQQKGMASSTVVKRVSEDLRKMAQNRGLEIDNLFRNVNGITFQIQSMESAYRGYTVFKPATRLFSEVAEMCKSDYSQYEKLLKEAKGMVAANNSVELKFFEYLAKKVSPAKLSALYPCYAQIEAFCIKTKVLQKPLFETTDELMIRKVQRTIEQNKFFRITHRKIFDKTLSAGRYYLQFIYEGRFLDKAIESVEQITSSSTLRLNDEKSVEPTEHRNETEPITISMARTDEDNRLHQKYPIIFKRMFNALQKLSSQSNSGVSITEVETQIGRIARPSVVEEILDNASWSKSIDDKYIFSADIVDHNAAYADRKQDAVSDVQDKESHVEAEPVYKEEIGVVDFNNRNNLAYTKPIYFSYFDEEKAGGSSWTELYVNFTATLIEDYPHVFKPGMSFTKRNSRIELAMIADSDLMTDPKVVPKTDFVLETNISASDIAAKMGFMLVLCGVDYENIVIKYKKRETTPSASKKTVKTQSIAVNSAINATTFSHFLKEEQKMAEASCRSYSSAINNCEAFAREHDFSSWRLYTENCAEAQATIKLFFENEQFQEYDTRQHNRFRAALNKFMLFLGTDPISVPVNAEPGRSEQVVRIEEYAAVLKKNFRKGFRMESPLELRKFRKYYVTINGMELEDSDEQINQNIKKMCLLYDGKAFLPDAMLSDELRESLLQHIDESFANGKQALYYQAIYNYFSEAFLDSHIHDAEMLRAYLMHLGMSGVCFNRSYISQKSSIETDPLSEIRECLKEHACPMTYEELFSELSHLPQRKIKFILASNAEFVNNGKGEYFHESSVALSDEELEDIAAIITYSIEEKEFVGGNELYDAIKAKYPYIIESNSFCSVYGFRDALKYKFGDRFSFKGNIISRTGQELSMADVFTSYAKTHDSFKLTELQSLASELATVIYLDSVYANSLRISKEQFVAKNRAQFSISETDEALDLVCSRDYISIQDVTNFGVFPYAGFPWNSYLLEHYVAEYSQKYMLLHSNYNGTKCAGAIVKRKAGIETFDDFIVDFLAKSSIELNKASALQILSDAGYLARRRYSNIESLIIQANAQRNRKDTD